MIVMKSDEPGVSADLLARYQIIRRNGAVVPFEPSRIAGAMMNAFLAMHGALSDRERTRPLFGGLLLSFFERVSVWRCQIWRLALDFKRAILVRDALVQRSTGTGLQLGVGAGRGFFSAAKPNLRNAP